MVPPPPKKKLRICWSPAAPVTPKLGNLLRYTYEDVELWLARQLELSRG